MADIYCKYCYKTWKLKKEFDKHINCCEFFYYHRRNPENLMTENGVKIPTQREMFALLQSLTQKCERLEKEVKQLKNTVSIRQRKAIHEWINMPSQIPTITFDDWWHQMKINREILHRVFRDDLTEGMKQCIETHLKQRPRILPIRAFTEKPNTFYVYAPTNGETTWRTMTNAEFETMTVYLSQLFLREFLEWQRENKEEIEEDEEKQEQELVYMVKINGLRVSSEKRVQELKKWLFPLIQESVKSIDF